MKKNINITDKEVETYNFCKLKNLELQKNINSLNKDISLLNKIKNTSIISFHPEIDPIMEQFSEQVAMDLRRITTQTIQVIQN